MNATLFRKVFAAVLPVGVFAVAVAGGYLVIAVFFARDQQQQYVDTDVKLAADQERVLPEVGSRSVPAPAESPEVAMPEKEETPQEPEESSEEPGLAADDEAEPEEEEEPEKGAAEPRMLAYEAPENLPLDVPRSVIFTERDLVTELPEQSAPATPTAAVPETVAAVPEDEIGLGAGETEPAPETAEPAPANPLAQVAVSLAAESPAATAVNASARIEPAGSAESAQEDSTPAGVSIQAGQRNFYANALAGSVSGLIGGTEAFSSSPRVTVRSSVEAVAPVAAAVEVPPVSLNLKPAAVNRSGALPVTSGLTSLTPSIPTPAAGGLTVPLPAPIAPASGVSATRIPAIVAPGGGIINVGGGNLGIDLSGLLNP